MEERLAHGMGSLFTVDNKGNKCTHGDAKCDDKWQARWTEGSRKPKKTFVAGPKGKASGLKHLNEVFNRKQVRQGRTIKAKGKAPLFEVYAAEWLAARMDGKKKLAPSSLAHYQTCLRQYINPYIGSIPIDKITHEIIGNLIERLESGEHHGNDMPVYGGTVDLAINNVIRPVCRKAMEDGWLHENPGDNHDIEDPPEVNRYIPTPREMHEIANTITPIFRLAIYLMAGCGLRASEVIGLTVDRIQGESIFLKQQWRGSKHGYSNLKHDKRGKGRWIPLDPVVMAEIQYHMTRFGITEGPLFPSPAFKDRKIPFGVEALHKHLRHAVMKLGLHDKEIKTHNLRHLFASMCVSRGIEIAEVSKMLGHFSIELTYKIYYKLPKDLTRIKTAINGFMSAEIPDNVVVLGAHKLAPSDVGAELSDLVARIKELTGMNVVLEPPAIAA